MKWGACNHNKLLLVDYVAVNQMLYLAKFDLLLPFFSFYSPAPPLPLRFRWTFAGHPGAVVRRPISANPGLNFNPGLSFFSSKAFSRTTFSILFRVANHQIVDKKNWTEFAF